MNALFSLPCSLEPLVWPNSIIQMCFTNAFLFLQRNSSSTMLCSADDLLWHHTTDHNKHFLDLYSWVVLKLQEILIKLFLYAM